LTLSFGVLRFSTNSKTTTPFSLSNFVTFNRRIRGLWHSLAIVVGGYSMYADAPAIETTASAAATRNFGQRVVTVNSLGVRWQFRDRGQDKRNVLRSPIIQFTCRRPCMTVTHANRCAGGGQVQRRGSAATTASSRADVPGSRADQNAC